MTAEQRTSAADSTKAARERLQSKKEAVEAELRAAPAMPQTDARTKGFLQVRGFPISQFPAVFLWLGVRK